MLSCKTTYAIQILDLLMQNKEGMSLSEIRNHFIFLPNKSFISDIVKRLEAGCLICNALPTGTRYYIVSDMDTVTLDELIRIADENIVFGTPAGFMYWQPGYLNVHPLIGEVELQLEKKLKDTLKSITIGKLLKTEFLQCKMA